MGMPDVQQTAVPNYGYVYQGQAQECGKYNWKKMDAYERIGVNVMDAMGAKNAVVGGCFGIFIFAIVLFFFRKQMVGFVTEGVRRGIRNKTNE